MVPVLRPITAVRRPVSVAVSTVGNGYCSTVIPCGGCLLDERVRGIGGVPCVSVGGVVGVFALRDR